MTKSLPYMMGKNIPRVSIILLLIASMTLVGVPRVRGGSTKMAVDPLEIEAPAPGYSFMVNITIFNVTNLGSFEFKLGYNTTILDAVKCHLTPISEGYFRYHYPINLTTGEWDAYTSINDTLGRIYFGCAVKNLVNGWTGNGSLLTINFTATAIGSCTLDLYETETVGVKDLATFPIEHTVDDGSVTVIPEFPAFMVAPLLLIATLAVAFLGKMVWSRKRKDVPTL